MKKALYGILVGLVGGMLLFTLTATAAPPDHARGKAVGLQSSPTGPSGNGANSTGVYDPYNVCLPSENGNHSAKPTFQSGPTGATGVDPATGKPCAGSVGNADDKNPPGQLPGPQDENNGYECDGNAGVAKGNPAHSFCTPPTTQPRSTTTTLPVTTTSLVVTTTTVPSTTSSTLPTEVEGEQAENTTIPTEVKGITATGGLAMTGGDILLVAGFGTVAVASGLAFTLGSKRK